MNQTIPRTEVLRTALDALRTAPQGVAALLAVETYLKDSGLDARLAALVKVRVSQINGCANCLHMHTGEARRLGESEARLYLLDAWRESAMYSERERAALDWAEALTIIRESHAPEPVYQRVRAQFSEKELTDLTIVVAMVNVWNRLSIGARAVHPADRAAARQASAVLESSAH